MNSTKKLFSRKHTIFDTYRQMIDFQSLSIKLPQKPIRWPEKVNAAEKFDVDFFCQGVPTEAGNGTKTDKKNRKNRSKSCTTPRQLCKKTAKNHFAPAAQHRTKDRKCAIFLSRTKIYFVKNQEFRFYILLQFSRRLKQKLTVQEKSRLRRFSKWPATWGMRLLA